MANLFDGSEAQAPWIPPTSTIPSESSAPPEPTAVGAHKPPRALWIAEYEALRHETITRIKTQEQLVLVALVAPGTVLSVGLKLNDALLLLLYPFFALLLTAAWAHQDRRKRQIGVYIKDRIEQYTGYKHSDEGTQQSDAHIWNIGWEHYLVAQKDYPFLLYFVSRGIFVGTELLALVAGLAESSLLQWVPNALTSLLTWSAPAIDFSVWTDPARRAQLVIANLWEALAVLLAIISIVLTLVILRRAQKDLAIARDPQQRSVVEGSPGNDPTETGRKKFGRRILQPEVT